MLSWLYDFFDEVWNGRPNPWTVPEAVRCLKAELSARTLDLVRGAEPRDLGEFHFGLGMYIRNRFGLRRAESKLRDDCLRRVTRWCDPADEASAVILRALRESLVRGATPEELARCRRLYLDWDAELFRRARLHQARLAAEAERAGGASRDDTMSRAATGRRARPPFGGPR